MKTILFLLLALLLPACPTIPFAPYSSPKKIEAKGPYTHAETGIVFPEELLSFRRVGISSYASGDLDISGEYQLLNPLGPATMTAFVYPLMRRNPGPTPSAASLAADRARFLENHLATLKQELISHHPGAVEISTEAVELRLLGETQRGWKSVFEFQGEAMGIKGMNRSEIWVFSQGDPIVWCSKFRVTYPKNGAPATREKITAFVKAFAAGNQGK